MDGGDSPLLDAKLFDSIERRASAVRLQAPGPDAEQLQRILRAGVRAPDHGRLSPWRFVVMEGDARTVLADALVNLQQRKAPDSAAVALEAERAKAFRAPTIVAVAARVNRAHKVPEIEQVMAVAAGVENMLLIAAALGFGSMWKTGGAAYDAGVKTALGLAADDHIVAFLYLGSLAAEARPPREVSLEGLVSHL